VARTSVQLSAEAEANERVRANAALEVQAARDARGRMQERLAVIESERAAAVAAAAAGAREQAHRGGQDHAQRIRAESAAELARLRERHRQDRDALDRRLAAAEAAQQDALTNATAAGERAAAAEQALALVEAHLVAEARAADTARAAAMLEVHAASYEAAAGAKSPLSAAVADEIARTAEARARADARAEVTMALALGDRDRAH
jgi:hypothetical protein